MRTKATVLGHPIHPMLVVVPLGALPTALVFDALRVWSGNAAWSLAAFVATLVGVAGIALAAVPGLVDYVASVPKGGPAHAVARAHMSLGLGLLGLNAILALLRWATLDNPGPGPAWAALGLNALGNVGLVAQGFLGGELRSRYRLGVETDRQDAAASARPRRSRWTSRG